ncbi:YbbR-like domain-containing protein [Gracilinema caldarium]|uniref:YbbR family protein n=1 Tax=Gracilinema caldarium (strain ATCC 51460 / DSM 7334 / H1) TaxID=744872 RepID=F8F0K4_GRAC1|nr:YbbR-like domain-containing protein [Gracilinema caldarium]AEJ19348.1 YbbR family protein [Gracilinema caldarium DSM 7334]
MGSWKLDRLINKLIENWPAKVLSLAVALLLSMFHKISILEERYFSVPLKVETSGELLPSGPYPRIVKIMIKGESNSLYLLQESDIEAYVDLSKYKTPGLYRAPIQIKNKSTIAETSNLEIQIDPIEVLIPLDQSMTKIVPITPSFRGYLESGYELSSYTLEPNQVTILGPVNIVNSINDVTTDFIELTGRKENFSVVTKINNKESLIKIEGSLSVTFSASIQQSIAIRTFEKIPIIVSGLHNTLLARPQINYGTIKLQGSQLDLDSYTPDSSILSVDCSDIDKEGTYLLPIIVSAPQNFVVLRYEPTEIPVEIVKQTGGDL